MDIQIRAAAKEDLPSILKLYAQPEMDNGHILSIAQAEQLFNKINTYPDYRIYVAINEADKIVGTFALLIMDNLAHRGAPSGVVEDVMVDPACHQQGIGKKMMQFALKICTDQGCYKLSLSSSIKRHNVHKFYEAPGFKQHGISFVIEPGAMASPGT